MADLKQSALDAWVSFQHAAETMKQNLLVVAGETRDTASAATKTAIEKIDETVKAIKDHLHK